MTFSDDTLFALFSIFQLTVSRSGPTKGVNPAYAGGIMVGIVAEGKEESQIHSSLAKVDQLCPVTLKQLLSAVVLLATFELLPACLRLCRARSSCAMTPECVDTRRAISQLTA
jgi:hypothetical protein